MNRFRRMTSRTQLDPHEARLCREAQVRMVKASRKKASERSVSGASAMPNMPRVRD